ncbi:ATP-dependent DNA ligase [Streptomyces capparidis]
MRTSATTPICGAARSPTNATRSSPASDQPLCSAVPSIIDTGLQWLHPSRTRRASSLERLITHQFPPQAGRESANSRAFAFDLLEHQGAVLLRSPYRRRRAALGELFASRGLAAQWALSLADADPVRAREWIEQWAAVGVEGVVAKGAAQTYQPAAAVG